jgi:pimeloyl-ACP methyl ester carboxylesterase/putative sterol carrier protein
MTSFPDRGWWQALQSALNADKTWQEAARYFRGRLELRHDGGAGVITMAQGQATVSAEADPMGADIIVTAPDHEWQRLLAGKTDWFEGMSPGIGQFSLAGDMVTALRNIKVMARTFTVISQMNGAPKAVAPSPPPRPSGKPTTGHYIDVDGLRVHYEEAGSGPPLICFHAACQDTLMYRHVLDGLSDSYRVIAVDAAAHGKTLEPPDGPFHSLTRHAELNEKLIAALKLDKPVILGCSMAGNLVLEMAARRPDAYRAAISAEGADYTPTVSSFFLDMLLLNGPQILESWSMSLTGNRTPPDRAREVVWQIMRAQPAVMRGDLTGYANFDKRKEVGTIRIPVLLLRGDADWLVSQERTEETQSRIPGSRIAVLAGTGHYPMIENPYEFNEAVRAFLGGLPS